MSRRRDLPEELARAPFHVQDADRSGVPRSRLRAKDLHSPYHGVRSVEPASTVNARAAAYAARLAPDEVFSHATAAQLLGMWVPWRFRDQPLDVTAVRGTCAPRTRGVRPHNALSGTVEAISRNGLPVTAPIDTWRQLSTQLSLDELIEAGDSLVRRQNPFLSMNQLVVAVARHGAHRGVRKLRAAMTEVREGADSPRETRIRLLLTRSGLPDPSVNAIVSRPGDPTLFGDLVYPDLRVIVEYDGQHHRDDPVQYLADIGRLERLASEGWTVIRVLNAHLQHPDLIVARVRAARELSIARSRADGHWH